MSELVSASLTQDYSRPHPRAPHVPRIDALKRRQIAKELIRERRAKL